MSEEEKNQEKEVLGANVSNPEIKEAGTTEDHSAPEAEVAWSNADGATQASIAPSTEGVFDAETIGVLEKNKKKDEESNEEKFLFPKIFISKEDVLEVKIEIVFDPSTGDVYSITQPGLIDTDVLESLKSVQYKFVFSQVSYDDLQKYRRQASFYDSQAGDLVINRLSLRSFYLINHLRETDIVDASGKPVKLEFDEDTDNLSLETVTKLYQTIPALLDVVMTLFERKLLMLFQVNQ